MTTSQPSVGDFIAVYEPLLAEGHEIVSIHLSSVISGTYESAMQARARGSTAEGRGGERIVVCDSRTGCGGMGLMILAAANAAERGANASGANERARALREELKIWFAVDTLDYLRRGGRIGAARAWIGTTLKIKPILTLEEEITPIERVRTRSRAFERMVDYARQRHEDGADAWVVQHVQDPENAARLVEACRPIFGNDRSSLGGRSRDRRPRRARRRRRGPHQVSVRLTLVADEVPEESSLSASTTPGAARWLPVCSSARRRDGGVISAGSEPADRLNPAVVEAMDEIGIDISAERRRNSRTAWSASRTW